ncbi:MAG: nitrogenase reductase [Actinobacteria bacterium]|nr:nitrogenase reductase [Actinomycetota bacterium]
MPKVLVCGRGGSGKSTLVALLARELGERGKVLVVDADESNLGLAGMLGVEPPANTVMGYLGGKRAVGEKLMARLRGEGDEELRLFEESLDPAGLPADVAGGNGVLSMVRIGKIEHSMEGCACPMGVVARSFLKSIAAGDGEWVLVDTEAGIEHFGRGVLEGADYVLAVVDPSREAVSLAEKACRLAEEAGKPCGVVLSKVDERVRQVLVDKLAQAGLAAIAEVPYSETVARANLEGGPVADERLGEAVRGVLAAVEAGLRP